MDTTYGVGEYRTSEAAVTSRSRTALAGPSRRALYCPHGAGQNAWSYYGAFAYGIQAFADAGYPTHNGDYGSSTYKNAAGGILNWGNSDHVAAIGAAVTWMNGLPGVKTDKVLLFGGSMGAVGVLNYYKANPSAVLAIALAIPVLDLGDISSNDKGGAGIAAGSFVAASMYGMTLPQSILTLSETVAASGITSAGPPAPGGTANTVNVLTSNGWQIVTFTGSSGSTLTGCSGGTGTLSSTSAVSQGYGASLVNAYGVTWPSLLSGPQLSANSPIVWAEQTSGLTVPVKIFSSDNDPIACDTAVCETFATAVNAAGGNVTVESVGAVGHSFTNLSAQQITAFFDANGGRS